jgi:hypothetical protein
MDTKNPREEMEIPDSDYNRERWLISAAEESESNPSNGIIELTLTAKDESRLFDLIGKIDHKILCGIAVYIEVQGVAYRVLYGVYWRSIYSGIAYWGLRCEEIKGGMWSEESRATTQVDIPICYTPQGWVVEGQSLNFLLYQDSPTYALQEF